MPSSTSFPTPMLHLLCGKIGSGKSTLAAHLAGQPHTVLISEDAWLAALYPGEIAALPDYLHRAARLRHAMADHVPALLAAGKRLPNTPLTVQPTQQRTDAAMESATAWQAVQKEMELHTRDVPGDRDAVLPWLLERAQADNLGLLAALLAATVYRVRGYNQSPDTRHLDRLAGVVGLDMAKWWSPTAQTYLSHVSKDRIAAVVAEVVGDGEAKPLLAMKKGEAAAAAERLLDGKGWVPELMRGASLLTDPEPEGADDAMQ
ncbi:ParB-like nuclease [Bordetella ansorpii]|uniref:ParB-like nuclease n=1 Tax=Bordetella ansorpii TaxID=288768 RepID=A0A157SWL9_9BORD|nr:ParB-like nuclease [Bordetella ansorpii]